MKTETQKLVDLIKASEATAEPRDGFVQCLESGTVLASAKKWEFDQPTEFQWMPGGITTINAHYNGKPIELTVQADQTTAKAVQASYEDWFKVRPKQTPFGCVEHREQEAAIRLPKDVAAFTWKDADGDSDAGIYCTAVPTELGAKNVNGRIHSSWSPSFTTDAEYTKAKEVGGRMVFPAKARGSRDNPAKVTGVAFSVGSLTNKPAFRNINPVKATEEEVVSGDEKTEKEKEIDASGTSEGVKKAWVIRKQGTEGHGDSEDVREHWNRHSSGDTDTYPDKAHITEPGQRIVTTAYRIVKGAAKQYPYSGAKVYESYTGKDGALKARPLYEPGPDRRSERLAKEDAISHAKYRNLPFYEGIRLGHVFNADYGEQQEKALKGMREEIYNKGSDTKEETEKVGALASLYPNETLLDDLYKQVQASEKPIDKLYAELVGVADQTAGQS